jgi:hypothetical protein
VTITFARRVPRTSDAYTLCTSRREDGKRLACDLAHRKTAMSTNSKDHLLPRLQKLESEIQKNLEEVCETDEVKDVDTGELIRIEETLSIAADAAKEAVSLRRRMHQDREDTGDEDSTKQQRPSAG